MGRKLQIELVRSEMWIGRVEADSPEHLQEILSHHGPCAMDSHDSDDGGVSWSERGPGWQNRIIDIETGEYQPSLPASGGYD